MGLIGDIASLIGKGLKSMPKILASAVSGITTAVQTWKSYNGSRWFNAVRTFNGPEDENNEEQLLLQALSENFNDTESQTILNTINYVENLVQDGQSKGSSNQCNYIVDQETDTKELDEGSTNIAIMSSTDANKKANQQDNIVYSQPVVSNAKVEVSKMPSDGNVEVSTIILPKDPDNPDSYETIDSESLNQTHTSKSVNSELTGTVYKIKTVENQLIPSLKLKYSYKDNEINDFIKKISLIWGRQDDKDKAYVDSVEKTVVPNFLNSVKNNSKYTVKLDTKADGTLELIDYDENRNLLQTGVFGFAIKPSKKCSVRFTKQTGSMILYNKPYPSAKSTNETFEFKHENIRFSFVTKHELLELAKLYIKKDITFDKILLKICYKHRHTSGLHPVFKKGELNRFVSSEQLNDLEDDEEYEENNVKFFFI